MTAAGFVAGIAIGVIVGVVAVFALAGHATQGDVRRACARHQGVAAVSGNAVRKFVACRDGFYRTVR